MFKVKIINPGDPNCIHHEHISDNIGHCCKCGQVRQYYETKNRNKDYVGKLGGRGL